MYGYRIIRFTIYQYSPLLLKTEINKAKLLLKPTIITRGQWGADKPLKEGEPIQGEVNALVLKFTQTETCNSKAECVLRVKEIQRKHMDEEGQTDIQHKYSKPFLIGGDGNVYEGRGFRTYPSYPDEEKFKALINSAIEIAFIGHVKDKPSMKMLKAMAGLVMKGMEDNKITKDVKKIKPCIVHGKDVLVLKDEKGGGKGVKDLFKEYKDLLKKS